IQRICSDYAGRGARCYTVYPDPQETAATAGKHRTAFGYGPAIPAVLDPQHQLVSIVGPRVTPEVAVYRGATRLYRGRIDDRYLDVGRSGGGATRRDVRLALDAALAGQIPSPAETPAVGCYITP